MHRHNVLRHAVPLFLVVLAGFAGCQDNEPCTEDPVRARVTYWEAPDYPDSARLQALEGTVIVGAVIPVDGVPTDLELVQRVHPLLDDAALAAAARYRFAPAREDCTPVASTMSIPFVFRLN